MSWCAATISVIGAGQPGTDQTEVIEGRGRTLMPGLIENHVHLVFGSASLADLNDPDKEPEFYACRALLGA